MTGGTTGNLRVRSRVESRKRVGTGTDVSRGEGVDVPNIETEETSK